MGVLTRIGELIKAFSVPQKEIEGQDEEEITVDKLVKIAEQSGTSIENIEELKKGYQGQETREEKFRREQVEAAQEEEKTSGRKPKIQENQQAIKPEIQPKQRSGTDEGR